MKNFFTRARIAAMLAIVLVCSLVMSAFANGDYTTPSFTDVPKSYWGYIYVEKAHEKGWVNGYDDGRFGPNDNVTYAQLSVMLTSAFFKDRLDSYSGSTAPWYTKYCTVANDLGLFKWTNVQNKYTDSTQVNKNVNRYEMAQIIYHAMTAAGVKVDVDLEAARASTADWVYVPDKYRPAVAAAKAAGLISGIDSNGTFGGDGNMTRAQACVVLTKLEEAIQKTGGTPVPPPVVDPDPVEPNPVDPDPVNPNPVDPKPSGSVVGTMSDTPVTLSLDTHKPIHDYWSSQSSDVKALLSKDVFNAAVQSMKDAEMILTQGEFGTTLRNKNFNLYYNYAMCEPSADEVRLLQSLWLAGYAYENYAYNVSYMGNVATVMKVPEADQLAPIFAPIFARFPSNATDKQKVEICVKEIVDRFDYETGTVGAGFDWINGDTKGNCENYTRAASQILAAAGIPNIQVAGSTKYGAHAWVLAYVDGSWMVVDGTSAESGNAQPEVQSVYEQRHSAVMGNQNSIKVAKALVEASLS